jgi:isoleucyl-tRNA synthetase
VVTKLGKTPRPVPRLGANYDWKEIERTVRDYYDRPEVRKQIAKAVSGRPPVGYVDGPPTLNNLPHVGHVRGRVMKDLYYRYSTLSGDNLVFRGGWDTQGLPVELQAEKELGLSGNKWEDLKKVGVERLVEACKGLIAKYQGGWLEGDRLIGLMMDQERAYMTYRDGYIEREWSYLAIAWKKGLLGEGYKVVPYCPSCQTSLSHAELSEYERLEDPSLYYKVRASDGSYLVIWTTMPFTVVTDEMVGVKPEADYEYVRVGDETWVLGTDRKEALKAELGLDLGATVKKVKGRELEGLSYVHPLLAEIPGLDAFAKHGKVHMVVAEEFVDTTTGTGTVHLAPANGEDDFNVAQKRGVPVFAPFDDQVKFTHDAGVFEGLFARDADPKVVELLRARGSLVKDGRLIHEYPVCWRSGHRLVWLARREYFYWVDKVKDKIVSAARKVEYYFDAPRNRFLEFIRESPPWCITRERVWGTPLPIWACPSCGNRIPAFSRKEILSKAVELPDGPDFELHRPWIDRVVLRCPDCGSNAQREPFVLDTWHNSGSAPYSSFSDAEYGRLVPVRFLTEGIDQTRGWAYTLLVLNVLRTGRPQSAYKEFLFQGHVLDSEGRKMSKSLGNVVAGLDLLRENSVDLSRFYLMWKASPADPLSLDMKEMAARPYQVLNTLYHLHVYLAQNGELDGYDPVKHTLAWARKSKLLTMVDEWLLAKLGRMERGASEAYEERRFNEACKSFEDFVITHLSQTYVRLVRGDLWKDDPKERKRRLAIYAVLGHTLRTADEKMHPVAPFVTEHLFQLMFAGKRPWARPLLAIGFSTPGKGAPKAAAEAAIELALKVEEACNSARTRAKLKRRWPLREVLVLVSPAEARLAERASSVMGTLCNVKDVRVVKSASEFPATIELTPNASRIGAQFKDKTRDVLASLRPLTGAAAVSAYRRARPLAVVTRSGKVEVPFTAFDLKMSPVGKSEAAERGGLFVAVNTERDEALLAEGLVRDVARRLQALRKERGFSPTAVLKAASVAGLEDEEVRLLEPLREDLSFLVRVKKVSVSREKGAGRSWHEEDLDGRPIYLDVG